jgi:hypothetical protein
MQTEQFHIAPGAKQGWSNTHVPQNILVVVQCNACNYLLSGFCKFNSPAYSKTFFVRIFIIPPYFINLSRLIAHSIHIMFSKYPRHGLWDTISRISNTFSWASIIHSKGGVINLYLHGAGVWQMPKCECNSVHGSSWQKAEHGKQKWKAPPPLYRTASNNNGWLTNCVINRNMHFFQFRQKEIW